MPRFRDLLQKIDSGLFKDRILNLFNYEPSLSSKHALNLSHALKNNPFIKELIVSHNEIGDKGIRALSSVQSLESIDIYNNRATSSGIRPFVKNKLVHLNIGGNRNIDDIGFLREINTLTELNARSCWGLKNADLLVKENQSIKKLDLSFSLYITEELLKFLRVVKNNTLIEELVLEGNSITDENLAIICDELSVKKLDLTKNDIGDKGAILLSKIKSLESLILPLNHIKHEGIMALSRCQNLKHLDISGNHYISVESIRVLAENKTITSLKASSTALTDEHLDALSKMSQLEDLSVRDKNITESGIKHLEESSIERIKLPYRDNGRSILIGFDNERKRIREIDVPSDQSKIVFKSNLRK